MVYHHLLITKNFGMKINKLLGIVALGLILNFNPLFFKFSKAGLLDFSDPLETCMEIVEKNTSVDTYAAAYACSGSTKSTLKCMNKVLKNTSVDAYAAATVCTGKN